MSLCSDAVICVFLRSFIIIIISENDIHPLSLSHTITNTHVQDIKQSNLIFLLFSFSLLVGFVTVWDSVGYELMTWKVINDVITDLVLFAIDGFACWIVNSFFSSSSSSFFFFFFVLFFFLFLPGIA